MVDFSVFNELSLPFSNDTNIENEFGIFFNILKELKSKNLTTIRMDNDFKNYEILEHVTFQEFFGQIKDRDFQRKIRSFITNTITTIDTPIIKDNEEEECNKLLETEYFYNGNSIIGGLACCDIWDTILISVNSNSIWDNSQITLQKNIIVQEDIVSQEIQIKHSSKIEHLDNHKDYFKELEINSRLHISQENFWENRKNLFPNKIVFSREMQKQIKLLDKATFKQAISILRDVENKKKLITDYNHSLESKSVHQDEQLKKLRRFTIKNKTFCFEKHLKSLPNANRIYFLEHKNKIYIGYIGKHLSTKKFH